MSDKQSTSQPVMQNAEYGIKGTAKSLAQMSSSGQAAKDRRKKIVREDGGPAQPSSEVKGGSQSSKSEQKEWK